MEYLISLLSAFLGGTLVAFIQYFLDKNKQRVFRRSEILEDKYRSLLVFMACALDIKKKKYFTLNEQVPNRTEEDYIKQIEEYYYHSILYSPDNVLRAIKSFIIEPTKENYILSAKAMRKDLWGTKTKLSFDELLIKDNK